jgi:hypothetical protein
MMRALIMIAGFSLAAAYLAPVAAEVPGWLSQSEIESALTGKTLEGHYASGNTFTERYLTNGTLEYAERGRAISGHWSVTAGTLCTIYDTDPTGGCYRVARVAQNCFEFYLVTRTEEAAPGLKGDGAWTARGAVAGEASGCHEGANV